MPYVSYKCIELIITAVVVVLWMGNNRANGHTVTQHVEQHNKIAQRDQFKGAGITS